MQFTSQWTECVISGRYDHDNSQVVKEFWWEVASLGVDFSWGNGCCDIGQSGAMQSAAAVALMPLLIFFAAYTTAVTHKDNMQKLPLFRGISGPPSNTCFLGSRETESPTEMASRSVYLFFFQGSWTWPTDRPCFPSVAIWLSLWCGLIISTIIIS